MVGSRALRHRVRRGIRSASAVLYAGSEVYCPVCQRHLRKFVPSKLESTLGPPAQQPAGSPGDPSLACPACGSLTRHRLLILFLANCTDVLERPLRMLHFAPEPCLHDRFRASPHLDYVAADLDAGRPMIDVAADITAIPFPDDSFDVAIASHVLEHVPDDVRALRELRRVLRPAGRAFLQHPIDPSRKRTYEDATIVDPDERRRAFGQHDHVRVYAEDFGERVRGAGFSVDLVRYRDRVSAEEARRCALRESGPLRGDDIYVCSPTEEDVRETTSNGRGI